MAPLVRRVAPRRFCLTNVSEPAHHPCRQSSAVEPEALQAVIELFSRSASPTPPGAPRSARPWPSRCPPAPYRRAPAATSLRHRRRSASAWWRAWSTMPWIIALRSVSAHVLRGSGGRLRQRRHRPRRRPAPVRLCTIGRHGASGRRFLQHRPPDCGGVLRPTVLFGGEADEVARLASSGLSFTARSNSVFASSVTTPPAAITSTFAEIGAAIGGLAGVVDRIAIGARGVVEPAESWPAPAPARSSRGRRSGSFPDAARPGPPDYRAAATPKPPACGRPAGSRRASASRAADTSRTPAPAARSGEHRQPRRGPSPRRHFGDARSASRCEQPAADLDARGGGFLSPISPVAASRSTSASWSL